MKNSLITITALAFVVALVSYAMVISNGTIRTVEFLSIFSTGALAGVLLTQIFALLKNKQQNVTRGSQDK